MNHLIIWKELSLFIGTNQRAISKHQHPLIQLIIGVDEPFLWKDSNGNWIEKKALLVSPNHPHECNANGKKVVILSIDTDSTLGEFINHKYLNASPIIDFSLKQGQFDSTLLMELINNSNWSKVHQKIKALFDFDSNHSPSTKKDERIQKVLNYIHTHIENEITTKLLMDVAYLSESRLLHLFKQEMGLPIRNYILWRRIQIAFKEIIDGNNLTQAAYDAGFSDQAHLSRTFVKTVGVPPSSLLKNSKFVQVFFPD